MAQKNPLLLLASLLFIIVASEGEIVVTEPGPIFVRPGQYIYIRQTKAFEQPNQNATYMLYTETKRVISAACSITLPCSTNSMVVLKEFTEKKKKICSSKESQPFRHESEGFGIIMEFYSGSKSSALYDCKFKSVLPNLDITTVDKNVITSKPAPVTMKPKITTLHPTAPPLKPVTTSAPASRKPDFVKNKILTSGESWRIKMVPEFQAELYLSKYELSTQDSCGLSVKCSLALPCDDVAMAVFVSPAGEIRSYYCGKTEDPFMITQTSVGPQMTLYFHSGYAASPSYDCTVTTRDSCPPEVIVTTTTTTEKPAPVGCQCGNNNENRIINGVPALEGEIPWQVAVQNREEFDTWNTFCGGTLVSDRHVITAGHCLAPNEIQTHRLQMGIIDLKDPGVTFQMTSIMHYNRYPPVPYDGDIAIIFISGYVDFSKNIFPACLPPRKTKETFVDRIMTISGWGRTESGQKLKTLMKTKVKVITQEECAKRMTKEKITENMMCAIGNNTDSCQGDSGGPMTFKDKNGVHFLTGVVSWGEGCNDNRYAGVYVRVTKFIDWFHKETEDRVCTRPMKL